MGSLAERVAIVTDWEGAHLPWFRAQEIEPLNIFTDESEEILWTLR